MQSLGHSMQTMQTNHGASARCEPVLCVIRTSIGSVHWKNQLKRRATASRKFEAIQHL